MRIPAKRPKTAKTHSGLRMVGLTILSFIYLLAFVPDVRAESLKVSDLQQQIKKNEQRRSKLSDDAYRYDKAKRRAIEEMRDGLFCSGCKQTESELRARGEPFPHEGQKAVRATNKEIRDKKKEYEDKIKAALEEIKQLIAENKRLQKEIDTIRNPPPQPSTPIIVGPIVRKPEPPEVPVRPMDPPPLTPGELAERARLRDLAEAGLAPAQSRSGTNELLAAADKVVSVWNRAIDVKKGAEKVTKTLSDLPNVSRPNSAQATFLVFKGAIDTNKLGGQVLGQLDPAVDALLKGDAAKQDQIEEKLNKATDTFLASVEKRTAQTVPEYAAFRSLADYRSTLERSVSPLVSASSAQDRAKNYARAARSLFEMVAPADQGVGSGKGAGQPAGPVVGELKKDAAKPLAELAVKIFKEGKYTEYVAEKAVTLYQVYGKKDGNRFVYWSRAAPVGGVSADGSKPPTFLSIVVPPGEVLYEGAAAFAEKEALVILERVDPTWIQK